MSYTLQQTWQTPPPWGTQSWSRHCTFTNEFSQSRATSCFSVIENGSREKANKKLCGSEVFPPVEKVWMGQVSFFAHVGSDMLCMSTLLRFTMSGVFLYTLKSVLKCILVPARMLRMLVPACWEETHLMVDQPKWPIFLLQAPRGGAELHWQHAHPGRAQPFTQVQALSLNLNYKAGVQPRWWIERPFGAACPQVSLCSSSAVHLSRKPPFLVPSFASV